MSLHISVSGVISTTNWYKLATTMTFATTSPRAAQVYLFVVAASEIVVKTTLGHGYVLEPPNRASLWRFPEFHHLEPPYNYDDNQLYCGNFSRQYELNNGNCGVCGDPYDDPIPRAHEDGGENYRGIIVRGYRSGELMPVEVTLTASHWGYFQFRLCTKNDNTSHWSQECYDQHLLTFFNSTSGKEETNYNIPVRGEVYYAKYSVRLPKGIECQNCVLQWHYQTGNRWGKNCTDGSEEGMGCGDQEVFRSCSDIRVYAENEDEKNVIRNPNSKLGLFPALEPVQSEEEEDNRISGNNTNWTNLFSRMGQFFEAVNN